MQINASTMCINMRVRWMGIVDSVNSSLATLLDEGKSMDTGCIRLLCALDLAAAVEGGTGVVHIKECPLYSTSKAYTLRWLN